ncbi:hypothetical protein [Cesiribacter sp. SM1]|uniref:hypothetical protein n=1 Tax=Cesiribacter sp. SM1 TaxID=2861196 RepID=UPI001CD6F32B|nr:hypothetical protein [Cesiribacter sp. SM1]
MQTYFRIAAFFSLAFFALCTPASAQDYRYKARVVLMNGDVLNGQISERWSGGNLYLYLSEKTFVQIDSSDIRKVKQEQLNGQKLENSFRNAGIRGAYGKQQGFYHHSFAGLSFGEDETGKSLGMVNGYRFNKLFALGLGVNYDRFEQASVLPIYLQPRLYVKNDKLSLYAFSDLGYSAGWQNKGVNNDFLEMRVKGGLMGQAGIGYQLNFARSALSFTLGYKLQQMEVHSEVYYYQFIESGEQPIRAKTMDIKEERLIRRVAFTVGFML